MNLPGCLYPQSSISFCSLSLTNRVSPSNTRILSSLFLSSENTNLWVSITDVGFYVELASAVLVWLKPNQSNRRSGVHWYFPLLWVFSTLLQTLSFSLTYSLSFYSIRHFQFIFRNDFLSCLCINVVFHRQESIKDTKSQQILLMFFGLSCLLFLRFG